MTVIERLDRAVIAALNDDERMVVDSVAQLARGPIANRAAAIDRSVTAAIPWDANRCSAVLRIRARVSSILAACPRVRGVTIAAVIASRLAHLT